MSSSWSFLAHITKLLSRPKYDDPKLPTLWPSRATAVVRNQWGEEEVQGECRRSAFFRVLLDAYAYEEMARGQGPHEELVEELKRVQEPPDPYFRWIQIQGELYEAYCTEKAKEAGVYLDDQVVVQVPSRRPVRAWNLALSGKIDLVVQDPQDGAPIAVEIKSVYGYNANSVLGTPAARRLGKLGTPRESNLMQIGLYEHFFARPRNFGWSRLCYGARDTGRFAEYEVKIVPAEEDAIYWRGLYPSQTPWTSSGIGIVNVMAQFDYVLDHLQAGTVPPRDYALTYDDDRLARMHEHGQLNKGDSEKWEKRQAQIESGASRLNKRLALGDWRCAKCQWIHYCYPTAPVENLDDSQE
jgi:hypothetical protein